MRCCLQLRNHLRKISIQSYSKYKTCLLQTFYFDDKHINIRKHILTGFVAGFPRSSCRSTSRTDVVCIPVISECIPHTTQTVPFTHLHVATCKLDHSCSVSRRGELSHPLVYHAAAQWENTQQIRTLKPKGEGSMTQRGGVHDSPTYATAAVGRTRK